jgi:hypothetical protein
MDSAAPTSKDKKLVDFEALVLAPEANENALQAFLEKNTCFIPTPDLLNHQLHLNSVIAKFPVGERYTDYAFLTKSTIEWRLVLVELEDSSKPIFKKSSKNLAFSSKFTDAVAQIDVWRDYTREHPDQIREKLRPLMVPPQMAQNALSIRYVLVIGQSSELSNNEARRRRLAQYGEDHKLTILTYDSIARQYAAGHTKPKAVLRANSRGYTLQSVEGMPAHMFAYIMPEHLELKPDAEKALRANQYDIDAWKRNEPLNFNEKWTRGSASELYEGGHPAIKNIVARLSKAPK